MTAPTVSPKTEQSLREAMARLFAGTPQRTNGKLTKNNLWREAGVSRATMNRATTVLAEWDNHVSESPAEAQRRQHLDELAEARKKLRESRQKCRHLQDQVDAAATVISTLLAETAALREQQANRTATIIPLGRYHAARE
ncbi:hypothetical protein [Streptomyces sp. IB2014 016-6]|uniref:hypothetical protein n=1 Tax=Streptomyces sp. IB2014 016-6 TaxID=2517818 RepID=UPI0011CBB0E6|nr:hypothetical protein [Streptomyces sp. IB2014 016-6]TXL84727.1 hypothetical protein EW053_33410 [Streptomyces sp. IB2014 016-6]